MGLAVSISILPSCKKRERLSASTASLTITPPASTVARSETLTLTARGSGDVNPTWVVSASTLGSVSPAIGPVVVFTPSAFGDVIVSAIYNGIQANSQIAIVAYKPNSNTFDVYNDNGLPSGSGLDSDIFDPSSLLAELSSGYTPEGIKYQRASNTSTGQFWGVTIDDNNDGNRKNLSDFSSGSIKFSLRLGRAMAAVGVDTLSVEITDSVGPSSYSLTSGANGFNRLNTDWQDISIPISNFAGLNTALIKNPFALVTTIAASPLTYDVDAVRWEK